MPIGEMRERLILQQPVAGTPDDHNARVVTWTTIDTVHAALVTLNVSEQLQAQALQSAVTRRFRIYVRADVTAQWRALWRPSWSALATPKTLEIVGTPEDPREPQRFMWLECGELAN